MRFLGSSAGEESDAGAEDGPNAAGRREEGREGAGAGGRAGEAGLGGRLRRIADSELDRIFIELSNSS